MEKYKLTDEQIETLRTAAERFAAAFKEVWDALKEIAKVVVEFFENKGLQAMQSLTQKQVLKQKFSSIAHTKGKAFKSQVQLNKPRFIQARSRL